MLGQKHICDGGPKGAVAFSAFTSYLKTRNLEEAYKLFLQTNKDTQMSFRAFVRMASEHKWQERVNQSDEESDLKTVRETRRAGLHNSLSAETLCAEIYTTCLEEMQLKHGEMTHADIVKYLKIATDVNAKNTASKEPAVVVNVGDNSSTTIDIDPKVLEELGRKMAEESSED